MVTPGWRWALPVVHVLVQGLMTLATALQHVAPSTHALRMWCVNVRKDMLVSGQCYLGA